MEKDAAHTVVYGEELGHHKHVRGEHNEVVNMPLLVVSWCCHVYVEIVSTDEDRRL